MVCWHGFFRSTGYIYPSQVKYADVASRLCRSRSLYIIAVKYLNLCYNQREVNIFLCSIKRKLSVIAVWFWCWYIIISIGDWIFGCSLYTVLKGTQHFWSCIHFQPHLSAYHNSRITYWTISLKVGKVLLKFSDVFHFHRKTCPLHYILT